MKKWSDKGFAIGRMLVLAVLCALQVGMRAQNVDSLYQVYQHAMRQDRLDAATQLLSVFEQKEYMDAPVVFDASTEKGYMDMVLGFCMATEWFVQGECQSSLELAKQSLDLVHPDSLLWRFEFYSLMGHDYQMMGNLQEALECCKMEMEVHERLGKDEYLSITLNSLAVLNLRLNNYEDALDYASRSVAIERKLGREDRLAVRLGVRADVLTNMDRYDEAALCLDEAMKLDMAGGRERKANIRKIQQALLLVNLTRYAEALSMFREAYAGFVKLEDPYYTATTLVNMASVETKMGRNDQALRHYKEAERLCNQYGYNSILLELYQSIEGFAVSTSNYRMAYEYNKLRQGWLDSIAAQEMKVRLSEMDMKYKAKEQEVMLEMERHKNSRRISLIILLSILTIALIACVVVVFILLSSQKKRNEELALNGRNKDKLISIITHDLRTPVLAQKQMLDNIVHRFDYLSTSEVKENCEMVKESAHSLNDQISNLVQWVSLRNGKMKNILVRYKPRLIVQQCIDGESTRIAMKSLKVINDIPADYVAYDDLNIVRTVVRNLLSNAVKFSYYDGEIHIEIEGERIMVSDNGMGIPADRLKEIFEPRKESVSGTAGEKGMGFGLFVCDALLKEINSSLEVWSEEGNGTKIGFRIHSVNIK